MSKRDNKIKNNIEEIIVSAATKSAKDNKIKNERKLRRKNNATVEHQSYKTILPKKREENEEIERLKQEVDTLKANQNDIDLNKNKEEENK